MMKRLCNKSDEAIFGSVAQMIHTIKMENEIESGTSYFDLFKGIDLRRTEICCFAFAGQMLAGAQFAYGPTYFFEQAGMSPNDAYKVGLGDTALSFCGTVCSWFLLSYFGRRTLYISGIGFLTFVLFLIGIVSVSSISNGALWAQAALCLLWQVGYSLTLGPIAYTVISETSAMRLRAKTVCLSRNVYNITAIICAILEPYMINPTEWDWKGKTAFFWCGTAAVTTVWAYFRLPECRGRTYEELDLLFAKGVSAREFGAYEVDPYETSSTVGIVGEKSAENKE
jgi:SP family general alpha glucoside:H+ symporter-like MFS transporter